MFQIPMPSKRFGAFLFLLAFVLFSLNASAASTTPTAATSYSLSASSPNLFTLNKYPFSFAQVSDCSGSQTAETRIACALKDKVLYSAGGLSVDVRVGSVQQKISKSGTTFLLAGAIGDGRGVSSESYSFQDEGDGFNAIFLDGNTLRVYAGVNDADAAAALAAYLFDTSKAISFNSGCLLSVSSNARAVVFKNCIPSDSKSKLVFLVEKVDDSVCEELTGQAVEGRKKCSFRVPLDGSPIIYDVFGSPRDGGRRQHHGVDLVYTDRATGGSPIKAAEDGVVVTNGKQFSTEGGCGNYVKIRHPCLEGDVFTLYCHQRDPSTLKEGQAVKKGDLVGYIGGSGYTGGASYGDHLHYAVRERDPSDDGSVNPIPNYLLGSKGSTATAPQSKAATGNAWFRNLFLASASPSPGPSPSPSVFPSPEPAGIKTGIAGVTSAEEGCGKTPGKQFSGGDSACVYFYLDESSGKNFNDVAFVGYAGNEKDSMIARAAAAKDQTKYAADYGKKVNIGQMPASSGGSFKGCFAATLPLESGQNVKGFYLSMWLSKPETDLSKTTDAGVKRDVADRKTVGEPAKNIKPIGGPEVLEGRIGGRKIAIESGHACRCNGDSGAVVPGKVTEATENVNVKNALAAKIIDAGGIALTEPPKDADCNVYDVCHKQFINWANDQGADVFVSIHQNSAANCGGGACSGTETYYKPGSEKLAQAIQTGVVNSLGSRSRGTFDASGARAGYILQTKMPSVLVETEFVQKEATLNLQEFEGKAAQGIFDGLLAYYGASSGGTKTSGDVTGDDFVKFVGGLTVPNRASCNSPKIAEYEKNNAAWIVKYARQEGIDPVGLALSLVQESNCEHFVAVGAVKTSLGRPQGPDIPVGIAQMKPNTGAGLTVSVNGENRNCGQYVSRADSTGVETSVACAARYYKNLLALPRVGGKWENAWAAYNAGPAGDWGYGETVAYVGNLKPAYDRATQIASTTFGLRTA